MPSGEEGPLESRLRAASASGDWTLVLEILDGWWVELVQTSPETVLLALTAMPEPILTLSPKFRLAREYICRNLRGGDHAITYRNTVDFAAPAGVADRLAILTGRIAAARVGGRSEEALRLVESARDLLREQPIDRGPELSVGLPEMQHQWGLALEAAGDFDGALLEYQESFDWSISTGHRMMRAASGGAIAYLHALHGRVSAATLWLEKRAPAGAPEWWSTGADLQARLAAGLVRTAGYSLTEADPLEGVSPAAARLHWAPYFFTRAVAVRGTLRARLLRHQLDTFLVSVPPEQRRDGANADYLDATRLILSTRMNEFDPPALGDSPSATAPILRQITTAIIAMRSARSHQARHALALAAPLLHADGSRPVVLVFALLATASASPSAERRRSALEEAVAIAHEHRHFVVFESLSRELRGEAAEFLDALGDTDAAFHLRRYSSEASDVLLSVLSRRERAVVEHAVAGKSTAQIAESLHVSANTVKSQLRTAYRKLGVSNRSDLVDRYYRLLRE